MSELKMQYTVVYDPLDFFEAAIAGTTKAQCVPAIRQLAAPKEIVDRIVVADAAPDIIILLSEEWRDYLLRELGARVPGTLRVVVLRRIPTGHGSEFIPAGAEAVEGDCEGASPSAVPSDAVIRELELAEFMAVVPTIPSYTASIVQQYVIDAVYPTQNGCRDAEFFKIGLSASAGGDIFAFVRRIVSNWRDTMEPDRLIQYGHFIAEYVQSLVRWRCKTAHEILMREGEMARRALVIDAPIYESMIREEALAARPLVILYSFERDDVTQVVATCFSRDPTISAREALRDITNAQIDDLRVRATDYKITAAVARIANANFFGYVSSRIVRHDEAPAEPPTDADEQCAERCAENIAKLSAGLLAGAHNGGEN